MTVQQFIEKAIEGGWNNPWHSFPDTKDMHLVLYGMKYPVYQMLLDPEAWKAVGKVEGWKVVGPGKGDTDHMPEAFYFQTDMIEALWEGKSLEEYLETL